MFSVNSPNPKHYSEQIIKDVRDKGFSKLRLRCRADFYSYNYSAANFTRFLNNLSETRSDTNHLLGSP